MKGLGFTQLPSDNKHLLSSLIGTCLVEQILLFLFLKFTMNTSVPVLPYCIIAGLQEEENTPLWYMLCSLKAETYAADRKVASKHSYNNKSLCEMSRD